jgi:hypothetical protein
MTEISDEAKKKAALARFVQLDRLGLIEHDWSTVNETGTVKVRVKSSNDNETSTKASGSI